MEGTLPKPATLYCKKCNLDNKKPVGTKCEKAKAARENKHDLNCDTASVKKTPKNKSSLDMNDKMMDMVMNTMTLVVEKLAAMDEHITGLASHTQLTPAKFARKSCSQEQTKRRDVEDSEEALYASLVNTNVIQVGRTSYSQIFADTTVALKPTQTPTCARKPMPEGTLGCALLPHTTTTVGSASATVADVISQVAAQSTGDASYDQTQVCATTSWAYAQEHWKHG